MALSVFFALLAGLPQHRVSCCLGGSEGGLHERDATVLAGEGFTVLALAYFGASGLPPGLIDIPLEYLFRGLDILAFQPRAGDRFGVLGGSRGGEAALLVAAHDQRVGAVVSVAGSGDVTEGIDFRRGGLLEILDTGTNSWTLRGKPIPYLPYSVSDEVRARVRSGQPVRLDSAFAPVPIDAGYLGRSASPSSAATRTCSCCPPKTTATGRRPHTARWPPSGCGHTDAQSSTASSPAPGTKSLVRPDARS